MQMKNLAVLVALPFALVACGDGGSSLSGGGVTAGSTIQSQFIDAPVKGLKYTVGSTSDYTGDNGFFNCKEGEEVTFSIKDKVIGTASCGSKIYISDMVPHSTVFSPDVAASFIQSLSNLAGGVLDLSVFNGSSIVMTSFDLSSEAQAQSTIFTTLAGNTLDLEYVDLTQAREHVANHLPDLSADPVMAELAAATTGGAWVTLSKTSGDEEQCWDKISAQIKVEENAQDSGKKNYRFSVLKGLGHDDEGNITDFEAECSAPGEFAECYSSPVQPRYMTGRSMSFSSYEAGSEDLKKDAAKVCIYDADFDYFPINTACPVSSYTFYLDKDYVNTWYEGLTMNFSVTDTSFTLSYHESGAGLFPNPATVTEDTLSLMSMSGSCSYSVTNTIK